jgi:predicted alpha/beta-hydrolase family hydrolase
MAEKMVYFAHGAESGPWGIKITHLAQVAKDKGFSIESPDYTAITNPDERAGKLVGLRPQAGGKLVLAGSSMGGYVSALASEQIQPDGLFLLAPAFYIPEYTHQNPKPFARHTAIVHGWHDDVVPLEHSLRYAKEYEVSLHILNSDHRLTSVLDQIEGLFRLFLDEVLE